MTRMTRRTSLSSRVGRARRRLRRARLLTPRRGPTRRPRKPPSAEAASSGSWRKRPNMTAAPIASKRWARVRGSLNRRLTRELVASAMGGRRRQLGCQQRRQLIGLTPFYGDFEDADRAPQRLGQADPVFRGSHRHSTLRLGSAGQLRDFIVAIAMVVGKIVPRDDPGAEPGKRRVEFCWTADAGEGENLAPGKIFGAARRERRMEHREPPGDRRLGVALVGAGDDDR